MWVAQRAAGRPGPGGPGALADLELDALVLFQACGAVPWISE